MALPTLEKTWIFDVNNTIGVGGPFAGYGELMFQWKTFLVANGWTVVASSDASTADATDRWINAAACNTHDNGGSPHSWIVLQNNAISTGFQICVDCDENGGGADSVMDLTVSEAAGFTGGTINDRPTATDEEQPFIIGNASQWTGGDDLTVNPAQLHMAISNDGTITRWWIYVNGAQHCFVSIEAPADPVPGWTIPWIVVNPIDRYASTNYRPTYQYLHEGNAVATTRASGSKSAVYLTSEGANNDAIGQLMTFGGDLDSGNFPIMPIGIWCDVAGARGRLGRLTDVWWGSTFAGNGDHYPGDASRQFVQTGDLVLPWPGGGAMLTT